MWSTWATCSLEPKPSIKLCVTGLTQLQIWSPYHLCLLGPVVIPQLYRSWILLYLMLDPSVILELVSRMQKDCWWRNHLDIEEHNALQVTSVMLETATTQGYRVAVVSAGA
jgi:hypothetical protein